MASGRHLRLAILDEVPLLQQIERAGSAQFLAAGHPELAGDDAISLEVARRCLADQGLYVIEVDGQVVGFVCFEMLGPSCYVRQVSVDPARQQQGLGSALMGVAVGAARSRGSESVLLDTQSDLAWNQPWYEKLGFVVVQPQDWSAQMQSTVSSQKAAGLDWSTRVHMRLELAPSTEVR